MSKNSRGIVHLFLLFVVILVAIGAVGYLAYQNAQLKKQSEETTTTPETTDQQPSPTPDSTADWKTYRNEKYGFEVKHHPLSSPSEEVGEEEVGQFTYLLLIKFGTVPLKGLQGYSLEVNKQKSSEDYRSELVGHITDAINSEDKLIINGNSWTKLNYEIFLTANYVPITTAIINHGDYGYAITASEFDIDQILSTFKFLEVSSVSSKTAIEKVKNLPDVKDYLEKIPNSIIAVTNPYEESDNWTIHVYEEKETHNATFNWYEVNKESGKIIETF